MKSARLYNCARCQNQVIICSFCDRGNIYCGSICSRRARVQNHRIANQIYQKSPQGRQKHAARQRRYRKREKDKIKKVTDHGSPTLLPHDLLPLVPNERLTRQKESLRCHFCDAVVLPSLRKGYLRHHQKDSSPHSSFWPQGP